MQRLPLFGLPGKRSKQVVKALSDVSFDLARCEAIGLVGESGSGKTTIVTRWR